MKRPTDISQLGKHIVDLATGEATDKISNGAAVKMGKLGGAKGGKARAEKLSPERRKEIATKASHSRKKKT